MKKLRNTLFVLSEDAYLTLDGENVVVNREKQVVARYPLHTLTTILSFSYAGASPALMGACAQREIGLSFCSPRGKFLARVANQSNGNVLLRRTQYRMADDPLQSCQIARAMVLGKLYNARWSIERTCRDHAMRGDVEKLKKASQQLKELLPTVRQETDLDALRGWEGVGANAYFRVLDDMILNRKETFSFQTRNRRPPLDPVNAMLSFAYSLLANDCASALEAVGLKGMEKKKVCQCSGGEQQRAAMARLLLKPCELILADEPTGNLDPQNKEKVYELLKEMNVQGKTVIIVTHDMELAKRCDRILVMDEGKLSTAA